MPSLAKNKSKSLKPKKVALKNGHKNGTKNGIRVSAKTAVLKKAAKVIDKVMGKATGKASQLGKAGKRTYFFGGSGKADGTKEMKNLLGGKGANLAEMANIGLPVPPGFTITTEVCTEFYAGGKKLPKALDADVRASIARMEKVVGAKFGDPKNPLLVSVRSGARASMPGMMDTILNLGLNDATAAGLAAKSGSERFAYDSYRRFIQMYSNVVLNVDHGVFEDILENHKSLNDHSLDTDLKSDDWLEVIAAYK